MKHFSIFLLACIISASNCYAAYPVVTTNPRFARGATQAFGRLTVTANGNTIRKRGFCFATHPNPTVEDSLSSATISSNGLIYWMKNMKPATVYYARAYCQTAYDSFYGDVIKIVTLPKGTVTWTYDNGGDSQANARINSAVASCVEYWNELTSITGFGISCHYGSSTPTADCSYGGWMRVGPNASYQRTGTIMHEALHGIGVGTHSIWTGPSVMRSGSTTGDWLGDRATEVLRFWDNSETATLHGDNTHLWPYGINGAHEDAGTDQLYIGTSLIAQALCEDGLPCSGARSFGSPAYVFNQEDTIKYYIKNEDESCGLYTSYLVESATHKLQWVKMTAAEAQGRDAAAWYITFTPNNQYYQFRNAATGYYISYSASTFQTSSSKCDLHLMRSRKDMKSSSGSLITAQRPYWIIFPDNGTATPPCMSASSGSAVTATAFNIATTATKQHWLLLTAEQAAALDDASIISAKDEFFITKANYEKMLDVPHIQLAESTDETLRETIATLTQQTNEATTSAEISNFTTKLLAAGKTFITHSQATDTNQPFDLTFMIENPDFLNDVSGWTMNAGYAYNYQLIEYYQKNPSLSQTLSSMPKGSYRLSANAFQRPGSNSNAYTAYQSGQNDVKVKLYLAKFSDGVYVKNVMEERSKTQVHSDDVRMSDGTYVPNSMASAAAHFKKGYYNTFVTYFLPTAGNLKIALSGGNDTSSWWTACTNFRLGYYGPYDINKLKKGDANNDGFVNVNDITAIADIILTGGVSTYNLINADVNGDGIINVNDITETANLILKE